MRYGARYTIKFRSPGTPAVALLAFTFLFFVAVPISHRVEEFQLLLRERRTSLNLGGGDCKWLPPLYDVPENVTYFKTLITGFPSGDKRLTFMQMESFAALPSKDEWDYVFLGQSNHPFIKANYPHHEGIWGWGDQADQVVLVVRNIRRTMVEYHDILWDIGYAATWAEAVLHKPNLFRDRAPVSDFIVWRDIHVSNEIQWYGWFIDYWMEGGLMRDIFSHRITTLEHWQKLLVAAAFKPEELSYEKFVSNGTVVTPSYDPHCLNDMPDGCEPTAVVSAEHLVDHNIGPEEGLKIAKTLDNKVGINVIAEEARECIWRELIINKKGYKTFLDREGLPESSYPFTEELLEEMIHELERLITKYSDTNWQTKQTARDLVLLLEEHHDLISAELAQIV